MSVSDRLKEIRKRENLSQKDFAEKLGISRTHYSNIENETVTLTPKIAKLICSTFKVNEPWLLKGEDSYSFSPEDGSYITKFDIMNGFIKEAVSKRKNQFLVDTIDSYSYFVSILLCDKYFKNAEQKEHYTKLVCNFIDEIEKYTFYLGQIKTRRKDFETLYSQKIREEELLNFITQNIKEIGAFFLESDK